MLEKIKARIDDYKEKKYLIEQEYIHGSSDNKDLLKESLMAYRFAINTLEMLLSNGIEEANFTYEEYYAKANAQDPTGCNIAGGNYIYLGLRDVKSPVPTYATHRSKSEEKPGYFHYYKKSRLSL